MTRDGEFTFLCFQLLLFHTKKEYIYVCSSKQTIIFGKIYGNNRLRERKITTTMIFNRIKRAFREEKS
jgi:hypothetical protein